MNPSLMLAGIPPVVFEYRLGNRSALDWVIDQYQKSEDKRSDSERNEDGLAGASPSQKLNPGSLSLRFVRGSQETSNTLSFVSLRIAAKQIG